MWKPSPPVIWASLASVILVAVAVTIGTLATDGDDTDGDQRSLPDLGSAAWMGRTDGPPTIDRVPLGPSVLFPAGVSYDDALGHIYRAARSGQPFPVGAEVVAPLPAEVVMVRVGGRLRVSLTAPFGWTIDGRNIRPVSLRIPREIPIERVVAIARDANDPSRPLPDQVRVDVPTLESCQIATGTPQSRPSCS